MSNYSTIRYMKISICDVNFCILNVISVAVFGATQWQWVLRNNDMIQSYALIFISFESEM